MGSGKAYSHHEIDDTRAAARDEAFEAIIERLRSEGADFHRDEDTPLYDESGTHEAEVGHVREVECTFKGIDLMLIRRVHEKHITGEGKNKSLESYPAPRVEIIMKRKPESADTWQIVDLDDMDFL